ncbi:unnamed protein product [Owenia fusiformis]|uniref:Uncharacterized protein n=1 Tax=Owenia fusiformis TaxID=6347 RepID=A0A8J1XG68_OWEFU|nr:unnamed protein product [Owenia fusiformis]
MTNFTWKTIVFFCNLAVVICNLGVEIGDLIDRSSHKVSGKVYAVDNTRLHIKGFTYDGEGPDAFFWINKKDGSSTVDGNGQKMADEMGSLGILGKYENKDITLELPRGLEVTDIKYLSVWCKQFGVNFGDIIFPDNVQPPQAKSIGQFSELAHGLRSGEVVILDEKTLMVNNLHYDGQGPDAFFLAGTGDSVRYYDGITKIPDETGSLAILKKYTGQTITLTLPDPLTVKSIDWVSMWCIQANQNFGDVKMPDESELTNIPPYFPRIMMKELENCEQLDSTVNAAWEIDGAMITIDMSAKLDEGDYISFGLSGNADSVAMINADVTVGFIDEGTYKAQDYYLNAKAGCSSGRGACPDITQDGADDVMDVQGRMVDGITSIRYTRPLGTGDSKDRNITLGTEMAVVWGIGRLGLNKLVTYHSKKTAELKKVNFGRTAMRNCPNLNTGNDGPAPTPWKKIELFGAMNNTFTAKIGPTGGKQGYEALTGRPSWGIAWYINNILIPEVYVVRNTTYKFIINGGNDPVNSAKNHPFYLTSSPDGGYIQLGADERKEERVFAGVEDGNATAAGSLCQYKESAGIKPSYATFDEYFDNLQELCDEPKEPAVFEWTPDADTPDVVYYQCFTHKYLGWKMRVVDEMPTSSSSTTVAAMITLLLNYLMTRLLR